jgi:hypothetical protein
VLEEKPLEVSPRRPSSRCTGRGFHQRIHQHGQIRSGAVLVYQLALLYRHEHNLDIMRGLKPFLRAAW